MMGSQPITQQGILMPSSQASAYGVTPAPGDFVGDDGGGGAYSFLDYATQGSEFDDSYLQFSDPSQGVSQSQGVWPESLNTQGATQMSAIGVSR
jgi:hypothetical protein